MPKWRVTYQSWRLANKTERRKAKQDLYTGKEPKKQYRTGKLWDD